MRGGDVAYVVHIEAQQRAQFRFLEHLFDACQPLVAQPLVVDTLFPIHAHQAVCSDSHSFAPLLEKPGRRQASQTPIGIKRPACRATARVAPTIHERDAQPYMVAAPRLQGDRKGRPYHTRMGRPTVYGRGGACPRPGSPACRATARVAPTIHERDAQPYMVAAPRLQGDRKGRPYHTRMGRPTVYGRGGACPRPGSPACRATARVAPTIHERDAQPYMVAAPRLQGDRKGRPYHTRMGRPTVYGRGRACPLPGSPACRATARVAPTIHEWDAQPYMVAAPRLQGDRKGRPYHTRMGRPNVYGRGGACPRPGSDAWHGHQSHFGVPYLDAYGAEASKPDPQPQGGGKLTPLLTCSSTIGKARAEASSR